MRLNRKQRDSLAKVLYDIAKYTFAGLVIGQIIADEKFKLWILIVGIILVIIFTLVGLLLKGGEIKK